MDRADYIEITRISSMSVLLTISLNNISSQKAVNAIFMNIQIKGAWEISLSGLIKNSTTIKQLDRVCLNLVESILHC